MKREDLSQSAEPTIDVPSRLFLQLIERAFTPLVIAPAPALSQPISAMRVHPPIGTPMDGGKFAGVTVHEEQPMRLVLLPGEREDLNHKDAIAWALEQGGMLPSRHDGIALFENMKSEFKEAWYWLEAQRAGESDYAWYQNFNLGNQGWTLVSPTYRARAVRRLPLQ